MDIRLHKNATTTPARRAAIQASDKPVRELAREFGVSEDTIRRWRKRATTEDGSHTAHRLGAGGGGGRPAPDPVAVPGGHARRHPGVPQRERLALGGPSAAQAPRDFPDTPPRPSPGGRRSLSRPTIRATCMST